MRDPLTKENSDGTIMRDRVTVLKEINYFKGEL